MITLPVSSLHFLIICNFIFSNFILFIFLTYLISLAALQYGIYKTNLSETEATNVLFVDVGYTNTSVSVVEFLKGKLRVIATAYDRTLGGRDFDQILVDHFVKEFSTKFKIDIASNQKALIRMEVACEKLKKVTYLFFLHLFHIILPIPLIFITKCEL